MPGTGLVTGHSVVDRRPTIESSVINHRFCFPDQVEFTLSPAFEEVPSASQLEESIGENHFLKFQHELAEIF